MQVKVQCPCETRFEFEVEPVNGRMPVAIQCPGCGADATELANAVIREKTASLSAAQSSPPSAPATPAQSGGLRIAKSSHASAAIPAPVADVAPPVAAPEDGAGSQSCPRHKSEPVVETCVVCGKRMCLKCMEQFGHVCSVFCREQATQKRIYVPYYTGQKSAVEAKSHLLAKWATLGAIAVMVACLGFWFWYRFYARNPKVVYSLTFPKHGSNDSDPKAMLKPDEFYQLIAPNQLLALKNKQLSLTDIAAQKILWTAPLQTGTEAEAIAAARAKNEEIIRRTPKVTDPETGADMTRYPELDPLAFEDDSYFANPHVTATTNDIWLTLPDHLYRFNRQTGSRVDIALQGKVFNVTANDKTILVLSRESNGNRWLTQIALPEAAMQSEEITALIQTNSTAKTSAAKPAGQAGKTPMNLVKNALVPAAAPEADAGLFEETRHPFIAAGPNAAQFETKLLEHKIITHEAMKPKGKSILDGNNVTASQGLDLAQEMMNESRREATGGVEEEDVSRYQVTVHRRFAKDVPDWTGEMTGRPEFIPLKTVDVIAASQSIQVLSKNNKKLWDAKLTFPVGSESFFDEEHVPCLESDDALYFADKGMLTCFDLASGAARWRLNSVGISDIQADEHGKLYIDTAGADPDAIKFSQQVNVRNKERRFIMKLDAKSGKVLWRSERPGNYYHCVLSGGFVYAIRNWNTQDALRLEEGPDTRFSLTLMDPDNGNLIWTFPRINHRVIKTEIQQNWILLHFDDEVLVLKFFSL